jgi:hypothetical protein
MDMACKGIKRNPPLASTGLPALGWIPGHTECLHLLNRVKVVAKTPLPPAIQRRLRKAARLANFAPILCRLRRNKRRRSEMGKEEVNLYM